ncbi:MAG: ArsS family sensor histidine kinase [Campylobacterota bacterium]
MSISKNSILKLISIFFLSIFILINALFWMTQEYLSTMEQKEQLRRFFIAERLVRDGGGEIERIMIKSVTDITQEELLKNGRVLTELPFAKMVLYKNRTIFVRTPPPPHPKAFFSPHPPPPPKDIFTHMALEDIETKGAIPIWAIFVFIDLLILLFFIYLMKKLLPLYHLKNAIRSYKDGDTKLDAPTNTNDELSEITVEFNHVLEKIASMKEARTLFMRNVFHELKTPIMKGSLTADCLEPSLNQERLKRIFERMGYLLDEFSKIERFGSKECELKIGEYLFVDLLDAACDILMCDKNGFIIKLEEPKLILSVDFELFAIALKNLLDNALKYANGKPTIIVSTHFIKICSHGEPILEEKRDFSKPFNRSYENSASGLGLGLYLTNSIVQKHGFYFVYSYKDDINSFEIKF